MRRNKKLLIMLSLLVCLVAAALLQKLFFPADEEDGTADTGEAEVLYTIVETSEENVTALSFTKNESELSFKKEGDSWYTGNTARVKCDAEIVASMVKAVAGLSGSNMLENVSAEKRSEYGFDTPTLSVKLSAGNNNITLLFGSYNKIAERYYICDKNIPDTVYTVDSSVYEAFSYELGELLIHDTLPEISADSINKITLGDITLEKIKTPTEENEQGYILSATRTENGKSADYSHAELYRMAEDISEWSTDNFVEFNEGDGSEYGFTEPILLTVNYEERKELEAEGAGGGYIDTEKELSLILGKKDEDGLYFFKVSENSPLIYKLPTSVISEIFG